MTASTDGRPKRRSRYHLWFAAGLATGLVVLVWLYVSTGLYGFNVLMRRGISYWVSVRADDPQLSPAMRVALDPASPAAMSGALEWTETAPGLALAELPVLVAGKEVDRILLVRVNPAIYRFVVRTRPSGSLDIDDWQKGLDAKVVINGSYFARDGQPDTPLVSEGKRMGPESYDAHHGAFVETPTRAAIVNLATMEWEQAFRGAANAMVSYPLLLDIRGDAPAIQPNRWLANRSFIGEDVFGNMILGTTKDAYFSLERLSDFLKRSPLGLTIALNLDGGPLACQAVASGTVRRSFCGRWETKEEAGQLKLLKWPFGTYALPIVLAVVPKG